MSAAPASIALGRTEPMAISPAITLAGVSRRFGRQQVLRDVSCSFAPRELILLLGANGAGKSTLLRTCVGLLRPDSGTITTNIASRAIGYVGHEPMLYAHLSVRENLELFAGLRGLSALEAAPGIAAALDCWGLLPHASKEISELSRGLQMRAALARTLHANPSLLFLDEPTSALDEGTVSALGAALHAIVHADRAGTVVMATHDIERVRSWATRVILFADGQIMEDSATLVRAEVSQSEACATVITQYQKRNR